MPSATAPFLSNDSRRRMARNAARSLTIRSAARVVVLFAADCIAIVTAGVAVAWSLAGPLGAVGVATTAATPPQTAWVLIVLASVAFHLVAAGRYTHRASPLCELRFVGTAAFSAVAMDTALSWVGDCAPSGIPDAAAPSTRPAYLAAASRPAGYALQRPGYWSLPVSVAGDATGIAAAAAVGGFHHGLGDQESNRRAPLPVAPGLGAPTSWHVLGQPGALRPAAVGDSQSDLGPGLREAPTRGTIPFAATRSVPGLRGPLSHLAGLAGQDAPILWPGRDAPRKIQTLAKSLIDVTFAATALLLTSPVLLAIALIIRLDGGPALFRHRRLGFGGRHFDCLKFRTMVVDAEQALQHALANDPALTAEWNATHKLRQDPRTTRIGAFLRRSSLDELPQLINVLWREMSLVGPRPITDPEVRRYGNDISYYYTARPGITGLWQVSGRSDTTYEQRVRLDVQYVTRWSLWHDLVLLFRTIPAVINRTGAH